MTTKRFTNQASSGWTTYGTFFRRSCSCRERRPETMKIGGERSASGPRLRCFPTRPLPERRNLGRLRYIFRGAFLVALRRHGIMKIGGERSASGPRLRCIFNSSHAEAAQPRQVALLFPRRESMKGMKGIVIVTFFMCATALVGAKQPAAGNPPAPQFGGPRFDQASVERGQRMFVAQ